MQQNKQQNPAFLDLNMEWTEDDDRIMYMTTTQSVFLPSFLVHIVE